MDDVDEVSGVGPVRVELVDPEQLPASVHAAALARGDRLLVLMRSTATAEEIATAINRLAGEAWPDDGAG